MSRGSSSSYCTSVSNGGTDESTVVFFLLYIRSSFEDFSRGNLGASENVVTPTAGVADMYMFTALPQPATAISNRESHGLNGASTSHGPYLRAKETVPSSFASIFLMGTSSLLEWEQEREAVAPLRTCGLKEGSMSSKIAEFNFLKSCMDGTRGVLVGWCSDGQLL